MIFRRDGKFNSQYFTSRAVLIAALILSSATVCPTVVGHPNIAARPKLQEEAQESKIENAESSETADTRDTVDSTKPNSLVRKFRWLARPGDDAPIVLDNSLRRPFLFFRDVINQRWPLGRLLFITMLAAIIAKIFAPGMVAGAQECCRKKFLVCLASSFIYTTVLLSISRQAFQAEAAVPMALGCIAIVQISYIIGMGLGINIFANILSEQIEKRLGQFSAGTIRKTLCRWIALITTVFILTAISAIPELGRLPRLGNRLVVLVAIIGLGGLISDMRAKSRSRENAQSRECE